MTSSSLPSPPGMYRRFILVPARAHLECKRDIHDAEEDVDDVLNLVRALQ